MKENLVIRVPRANLMLILCNEGLEFSNKNKTNKHKTKTNKQTNKEKNTLGNWTFILILFIVLWNTCTDDDTFVELKTRSLA